MIYGNILPFWAYYTLFSTYTVFEFGKNANSPNSICEAYSHIYFDLFGDNWSLRFSVRWLRLAHFLFSPIEKKDRRKKEMNKKQLNLTKENYATPDVDVIVTPCVDVITSSTPKDSNQGEWDEQ